MPPNLFKQSTVINQYTHNAAKTASQPCRYSNNTPCTLQHHSIHTCVQLATPGGRNTPERHPASLLLYSVDVPESMSCCNTLPLLATQCTTFTCLSRAATIHLTTDSNCKPSLLSMQVYTTDLKHASHLWELLGSTGTQHRTMEGRTPSHKACLPTRQ